MEKGGGKMNVERNLADKVEIVAATGTDQDRARIEGEVARSRWGLDEAEPVNPSVDGNTPDVVNENRAGQTVIVFKKPVDFSKGGKIPF